VQSTLSLLTVWKCLGVQEGSLPPDSRLHRDLPPVHPAVMPSHIIIGLLFAAQVIMRRSLTASRRAPSSSRACRPCPASQCSACKRCHPATRHLALQCAPCCDLTLFRATCRYILAQTVMYTCIVSRYSLRTQSFHADPTCCLHVRGPLELATELAARCISRPIRRPSVGT